MKKLLLIFIILHSLFINVTAQNVGIGTTTPNASAALDISSTDKGFLLPRMTTAQRNTIVSPAVGLQIFNLDDGCNDTYDGQKWAKNCSLKDNGAYILPPYSWTPKADIGVNGRAGAVGFSVGTKGYIGTGNDGSGYLKDFWEYDPLLNSWTQKADFGGTARGNAVGFSIGTKGYIGTGYNNISGNKKDFWEYDPMSNIWTQKTDFGGTARKYAVGFSIGSKGYLGTGDSGPYNKDFWEFDPLINSWTQKADFTGTARAYAVGFSIGAKGYIGTGYDSSPAYKKDFWEFTPAGGGLGTWLQRADFGGTARIFAVGFSIGTNGFIGTGSLSTATNDFWEYFPAPNYWNRQKDFSGGINSNAVGFSIGTNGYIGTGSGGQYKRDFWEYNSVSKIGKEYRENIPTDATKYIGQAWTSEANEIYTSLPNVNATVRGNLTVEGKINTGNIQLPAFQPNWQNYGSGYAPASFYKDKEGVVHLSGLVKNLLNPAPASIIFVLPVGFRPLDGQRIFIVGGVNVATRIEVATDGNVYYTFGGSTADISLDGITFRAEY